MHSNYYLIAYCYYRMKEEKLTFTYLVRGAVFSSSSLKKKNQYYLLSKSTNISTSWQKTFF